jgi:predicted nucleotidyltransferase component of viral defense system
MIPQVYINAWRENAPWALDAQVEQDLVISRALVEIFSSKFLSEKLAFRGGTALNKLYLNPPARYSEDIDLVQIDQEPIGDVLSELHDILDHWLGKTKYKQSEGRVTLTYRFESEIPPVTPLKLKVEINTREHHSLLGLENADYQVQNPWFTGTTKLTMYKLEELMGTKIRALFQRKKGRDLFDLVVVSNLIKDINWQEVIRCFEHYMEQEGNKVSRAEFEENMFNCKSSDLN